MTCQRHRAFDSFSFISTAEQNKRELFQPFVNENKWQDEGPLLMRLIPMSGVDESIINP